MILCVLTVTFCAVMWHDSLLYEIQLLLIAGCLQVQVLGKIILKFFPELLVVDMRVLMDYCNAKTIVTMTGNGQMLDTVWCYV